MSGVDLSPPEVHPVLVVLRGLHGEVGADLGVAVGGGRRGGPSEVAKVIPLLAQAEQVEW